MRWLIRRVRAWWRWRTVYAPRLRKAQPRTVQEALKLFYPDRGGRR